ncbi:transcription factor bHLH25-like [Euphorbia lathyris]|uniref:transcription factor bHLH25-like n=1 Tax=Euphorbia lathyris TaxID=212925 RepID=UPI0033144C53
MDIGSPIWFPQQELEDYSLIHEYNMKFLADLAVESSLERDDKKLDQSLSYPSFSLHKLSSDSQILSFEAPSASPTVQTLFSKPSHIKKPYHPINSHAQNHILAERRRRENLSQQFKALSAMLPTLNKKDKASVLGDAIKYVKQLEEKVQVLEQQTKKRSVESVVLVQKSHVSNDDDFSSCDEKSTHGGSFSALPEIEARVSEKDILVRIHCHKKQGVVAKILNEIENLHLSIINTIVLPFGNSTLDITIIAQMDAEFSMALKDLVKSLRLAFLKFM